MRPRVPALTTALRDLLHQESFARWSDGWALARRLGPPALPAIRAAFRGESNRLQRWTLLGACAVAGMEDEGDAWLVELATAKSRTREERALALLSLAVLPRRAREAPTLVALTVGERPGSYLQVGAVLAASRFEAELSLAAPPRGAALTLDAIGTALAGAQAHEVLDRGCAGLAEARPALAGLVVRAFFLGRAQPTREALELASVLALRAELTDTVRAAAALFAARGAPELTARRLGADPGLRAVLVSSGTVREGLWAAGRLGPVPELFALPKVRTVLACAYGLAVPWERAYLEFPEWGREPAIADAVSFALAWRCAARNDAPPPPAEVLARGTEASAWLGIASGGAHGLPGSVHLDARAVRVAELARQGRLDRGVLARELEDLLWRRGLHPGLAAERAWTDLVRDSLLAGSQHVSGRLQLPVDARPPLPRDIEDSHEKYFRCADELFRFLTERGSGPPPELRLR